MLEQTALLAAWKLLLLRASYARLLVSIQPGHAALKGPLLHSSNISRALSTWQQQRPQQELNATSAADSQPCTASAAGGSATLQPAPRQSNSSSNAVTSSSSTPSTGRSKAAKNVAGDKPFQDQRLTWQQQQRHSWQQQQQQQVLPCSSSHGQDHSQPDQQCYQGPAGGVVILPKQGTLLWQATFNGNVPTHWWQQDKTSCSDSSSNTTTSSSNSSTSSSSIASWEQLVQQSPVINSIFRPAGDKFGLSLSGLNIALARDAMFGKKRARHAVFGKGPPSPRAAYTRTALLRMSLQLAPVLTHFPGEGPRRSVYAYNRQRLLRGRHSKQQQQQQGLAPRRFDLRSRGYLAAAADALAANREHRYPQPRPAMPLNAPEAAAEGQAASTGVGTADYVPDITMSPPEVLLQAQQYAAAAGSASRCLARMDQQGRLLPLPDDCNAAGSGCSGCSSESSDSVTQQHQEQQQQEAVPERWMPYMPRGCSSIEWVSAGRSRRGIGCRPIDWKTQRAEANARAAAYAAAATVGPHTHDSQPLTNEDVGSLCNPNRFASAAGEEAGCYPDAAAAVSEPSWWPSSHAGNAAVSDYASDGDVASSDDEDDSDYDSDDDSDDEDDDVDEAGPVEFGLFELSPEEMQELLNPHTFRTTNGVLYGFWSKCPLG